MKEIYLMISREWTKARTVFTAAFYGVFLYCILAGIKIPPELNTIISTLFGYWFGQGKQGKTVTPNEEVTK